MSTSQEQEALHQINTYIRTRVWRNVRQYGPLPGCFCQHLCDDVVQQVHENLCKSLGSTYPQQIARAMSAKPSSFKDTREHEILTKAITRAIGKARWTVNKRKQRGLPQEVRLPEGDEGVQHSESTLVDMTTDLLRLFHRWSPLERKIWQDSAAGKTTRQLGEELSVGFQRVAEIRKRLLKEIAAAWGTHCLEEK